MSWTRAERLKIPSVHRPDTEGECNSGSTSGTAVSKQWCKTFELQVGDSLMDHRWDGRLPVLLPDAVRHDAGFDSHRSR